MANPNTIPYKRHQDIQIDDVNLRTQFQNYIQVGQYQQALDLLQTNEQQLDSKAYVAAVINTIINGILTLENYYNDGVTVFLSTLSTQFQYMVDSFKNMRQFNPQTQYDLYNFVISDEQIYMALDKPPVGTLPTDTSHWLYLGLRGEVGAPGVDLTMEYDWNANTIYQPNDIVVYNKTLYVNIKTSSGPNTDPVSDPDSWLLFMKVESVGITVGPNPPQNPIHNTVWFQTEVDPLTVTDTSTPVIGVFNRYNQELSSWELMYPLTVFRFVNDRNEYIPVMFYEERTIQVSDWVDNVYSFSNSLIGSMSIVNIFPIIPISDVAYKSYNDMRISISGSTVSLTVTETPTVPIGIRVKIQ